MIDSMNDLSIATVPSLANNSLTYAAPTSSSSSSSSSSSTTEKKKKKVGWSKGFLNSTTQLQHKTMATTSDEMIYEVDVTAKDSTSSSIVVQATSSDTLQSMDNYTNTTSTSSIVKTNDLVVDEVGIVKIDKPEVIVASKKNVAFTGHIFERITP